MAKKQLKPLKITVINPQPRLSDAAIEMLYQLVRKMMKEPAPQDNRPESPSPRKRTTGKGKVCGKEPKTSG